MRTPTEALKEIRDRLTYFCLRTDGRYDPPWVTEIVGIIDEAVTDSHTINNAAAMREALVAAKSKAVYISRNYTTPNSLTANLMKLIAILNAALSAPARNCDLYATYAEAAEAHKEYATAYIMRASNKFDFPMEFDEWLFAPAAERKGEKDDCART